MSARRPLQPLSPLAANAAGAKPTYTTRIAAHDDAQAIMYKQAQDDNTRGSGSIISGLTSLENDAEDDFERLMIQNERDEQRLHEALRGHVQPFRKARGHPNVALTLENLARNNARNGDVVSSAPAQFHSPSSSSGSARSDPAVRPPAQWGRKGRPRRDWLRTITATEEQEQEQGQDVKHGTFGTLADNETPRQARHSADIALPSVEDSPLSHKSLPLGTPSSARARQAPLDDESTLDLSLDFNEASMIASTPYIPRSTKLDDIRQREIESLKEQALTTNRLDRIRETSPEEKRRPSSSSSKRNTSDRPTSSTASEQPSQLQASPEIGSRRRTNSWKTIGKSQPVTGEPDEQSPNSSIVIFKRKPGDAGAGDSTIVSNARTSPPRRPGHRKDDSQELLRRLARVSSGTPSPGRAIATRPHTAPTQYSQPTTRMTEVSSSQSGAPLSHTGGDTPQNVDSVSVPKGFESRENEELPGSQKSVPLPPGPQPTVGDINATPLPEEPSILAPKTPVVTGAWVDTPGPRTTRRSVEENPEPQTSHPELASSSQPASLEQKSEHSAVESRPPIEPKRPVLPGSALEAIVEEARTHDSNSRHRDEYGDSTIDSLEELITPRVGPDESGAPDVEDDTLQGLQLPTAPPRNEKERLRQQELRDLHQMNQRLRAARTGIRDASRGIKRIESQVEHVEENGQTIKVVYRDCPCVAHGHQGNVWLSAWTGFKHLFYNPKSYRRMGLTWLSIFLIAFLVWFLTENAACEVYCHKLYAHQMKGFGVVYDAPRYPFVVPTLFYRKLVRSWSRPLHRLLTLLWNYYWSEDGMTNTATITTSRVATRLSQQATETLDFTDLSMNDDEVIYGR